MHKETTSRGFGLIRFNDSNGTECTVQESSAYRDEGLIWLGAAKLDVKVMRSFGFGWQNLDIESLPGITAVCGNERMHLTQSVVKEILPILTYFAEHGHLLEETENESTQTSLG